MTGPADPATIDLNAASDLGGANATGTITLTGPQPGATTSVFHGDILAGGCVRVQGNQAIVVGKLPAGEVFTYTGGFGPITHVAALIEDNGATSGAPVDRASAGWLKSTTATQFCTTKPFSDVANQVIALDSGDVSFGYKDLTDGIAGNPDSTVSVIHPNGLSIAITDRPDGGSGKGLNVAVGAGSGSAEFLACGFTLIVPAGGQDVVTCGSLILEVVTGSAEVVLADGVSFASIPEGGMAEIGDDGSGGSTVENLGTEPITVTNLGDQPITVIVDGVEGTVDPGETSTVEAWDFQGFLGPVDNPTVLNKVKAGAALPLKWRILNALNAPVTDLSTASITVTTLDCATGVTEDQIEETAAGGSGLQNLGNGYYQLNWKTPTSYARSCKTLHLDIGDGVTHDAFFQFTK